MFKLLKVIKFEDKYFENGDILAITKNDGSIVVGSLIIKNDDLQGYISTINDNGIYLDVSEKYKFKAEWISKSKITNIQKVNQ